MNNENKNLENNISRLVKLTGDYDKPGKAFTDSLINDAIDSLGNAEQPLQGDKTMKSRKTLKVFAYAALMVLSLTIIAAILMPSMDRAREHGKKVASRAWIKKSTPMMQTGYYGESFEQDVEGRAIYGGTTLPNGESVGATFFKNYGVNPFIDTDDDHLSTFAVDVDTASYSVARSYLLRGLLPPNDSVRVEEFVNYFKYDYQAPEKNDFAVYAEASPWQFGPTRQNSYLLRLAIKGRQISDEQRKPAILTFVIDVSGSMDMENRLGLVKKSLKMLVERLRPEDKIGIAIYGSRGSKLMDYKGLDEKAEILAAIDSLRSEGSTYAEEGIRISYEMAEKAFKPGYINRVILCSDGVANVGQTGADDIMKIIKDKADKGVTLSALGFGMENYNDILMEHLGDRGNGHYAYIGTIDQAKRLFGDNLTGTLEVIARDVKVQVDFNPDVVRGYRLIGYENRDVPDENFRDDKYDGGEVGAGHSVTALYELKLWPEGQGNIATTYLRYKDPDNDNVTELEYDFDAKLLNQSFDQSSKEFRLAATVAEFAEILRESYWAKGATLKQVLEQAQPLTEEFEGDADVLELVDLISKANKLVVKPSPESAEEKTGE